MRIIQNNKEYEQKRTRERVLQHEGILPNRYTDAYREYVIYVVVLVFDILVFIRK